MISCHIGSYPWQNASGISNLHDWFFIDWLMISFHVGSHLCQKANGMSDLYYWLFDWLVDDDLMACWLILMPKGYWYHWLTWLIVWLIDWWWLLVHTCAKMLVVSVTYKLDCLIDWLMMISCHVGSYSCQNASDISDLHDWLIVWLIGRWSLNAMITTRATCMEIS